MKNHLPMAICALVATLTVSGLAFAQDSEQAGDEDGSSERVESSDDAYRRRMELEDARRQDPSYTDPVDSYKKDLEKIDKLPEESRENIRDQLVDVIVKNGEWEPSDALDEYPYEPTEAAKGDPVLMEQEQEAWDEQIEKYHEREAAAFGAYRGPVPGPGNPTGKQGGQAGSQGSQPGQQGQGQGNGQSGTGSAGTYQHQSNRSGSEDEVSTDGVSESALDFLKGRQGQAGAAGQPGSADSQAGQMGGTQAPVAASSSSSQDEAPSTDGALQSAAQWAAQQAESAQGEESQQTAQDQSEPSEPQSEQQSEEQQQQTSPESEQEILGIIAIEDLDKLEGAVAPDENEAGSENER